ncbi:poly-gamma-glutamate hydrolase family protein [Aliiroseovarius subalbicans]|uniref:poly-gamma-glutamate hydrolase family protein n=1 Tax=Aliiroseovarius subalbicans TaxID=2925840 RepID=UPI001F577852|nr:poly-gamma-glutamate hydrolase family protein [Aliiroseovarius subalbicans]MCI2400878.1 poly-gamma-glutamate hydrolase family protein [Aliiroseovarius subalbicans]
MAKDQYSSFKELYRAEKDGTDYQKQVVKRTSNYLIMAPHGGRIEPGTSELAKAVASGEHSLYLFEGIRKRPHSDLHVTSHRYDDEDAIEIASEHAVVVAFHGRRDRDDPVTVHVGGLDAAIRDTIVNELELEGFDAAVGSGELAGEHTNNICNRGSRSMGVQLEIPKSLRNDLLLKPDLLENFSRAVRKAITLR